MRKLLFLLVVKIDLVFKIDERLAPRGIDGWANFLERANWLWPEYDGETFMDLV